MRIDVWFDLVCPFCHVGRRHLDLALAGFEHADECHVIWHSYQLDRQAPPVREGSNVDHVAAKYGVSHDDMVARHEQMARDAAEVGLDFQWDKAVGGNSYDAHRLVHLARSRGLEQPVLDALMTGWYTQGRALGDRATLIELGEAGGLSADEITAMLDSDDFGPEVRTDEALAAQIGITAVPTYVFDQKYAVTGAQPPGVLLQVLNEVWADRGNPATPREGGGGCGGGGEGGCGSCGCGGTIADEPA